MANWIGDRVRLGLNVLEQKHAKTEEEIQATIETISRVLNMQWLEPAEHLMRIYLLLKKQYRIDGEDIYVSSSVLENISEWTTYILRTAQEIEELENIKRYTLELLRLLATNWGILKNQWVIPQIVSLVERNELWSVKIQLRTLVNINSERKK